MKPSGGVSQQASQPRDAAFRVRLGRLALATSLTCLLAHALSHIESAPAGPNGGPLSVVLGQAVWNAAQVGLLLLLLTLWRLAPRAWVAMLGLATLLCLPFAVYAISPGAWAFTILLLATCATAWAARLPDLQLAIVDAQARGTPTLAKVEFVAVACNLFSSMYNFGISRATWPHWASVFEKTTAAIGYAPRPEAIARGMYTLGLGGVSMPPYIASMHSSAVGSMVFVLIWTVLPCLYALYFLALYLLAKNSYGTRVQQFLCIYAIFHFLFLTDIVDYQFGRGIMNAASEWCHWSERFVWRIAVLLPIYQNLASGQWRRGNGVFGVLLHHVLALWAATFLVYAVFICDGAGLYKFLTGKEASYIHAFMGPYNWLGYPAALVFLTGFYAFSIVALRCKRVQAEPVIRVGERGAPLWRIAGPRPAAP